LLFNLDRVRDRLREGRPYGRKYQQLWNSLKNRGEIKLLRMDMKERLLYFRYLHKQYRVLLMEIHEGRDHDEKLFRAAIEMLMVTTAFRREQSSHKLSVCLWYER